jgi:2,5-furandicarboxylate decarboxylase 1
MEWMIYKIHEGEAKNRMLGTVSGHSDVDLHDPAEVEWVVSTRVEADHDVVIIPGAQGSRLDPKMGIDATIPLGTGPPRFERIRVPDEETVDPAGIGDRRPAVAALW